MSEVEDPFGCGWLAIRSSPKGERRLVDQNSAGWNQVISWLPQMKAMSLAA